VLIEFAPVEAAALEDVTRTSLLTALGALAALLAGALALSRLTRRTESLQEAMERQRRLASLGEMSAVLAHEIRNPLAALKGHAQLLLESLAETARERANAERVVREATRLEALTEDLLSLVRAGRIDAVRADPLAILHAAAASVDGARIDVVARDVPGSWRLDPERMRQVLENLLRNALEASPEPERVAARIGVEDGALVIAVRDRGAGLPPGEEGRVFEPFFTTRARGTGLGLAVARRIVELHGGSISARNAEGGGAEVRIVLP
jgi:two-component system sensor histidine kinase HydH